MSGVLEGVRVLDFGRYIAGPWCATLLGDLGAEVIRVEKRGGSEDRYLAPASPTGEGALFLYLGRNKLSLTLDPRSDEGREIVRKLVVTADVVVANLPPQGLRAMGLDYARLREVRPDIVLTTASGFGTGGPGSQRLGFDGVAQAASGAMYLTGRPGEPLKTIAPYVDFGTGTLSAFGTLAALMHRERTGEGQHVEASLLGTALAFLGANLVEEAALGIGRVASGNRSQHAGPADAFRTRDGWIVVQCIGNPLFRRWCGLVGAEAWLDDPRFASDQARGDAGEMVSARMAEWCEARTTAEALEELEGAGVPAGPVLAPSQVLEDEHIRAMRFFREVAFPGREETVSVPDTPLRFSSIEAGLRDVAPRLGEHTDRILASLGYTGAQVEELRAKGVV